MITDKIFHAFLKCETKSYLKSSGAVGDQREFTDWDRKLIEDFKRQFCAQLRSNHQEEEYLVGGSLTQALKNDKCRLALDCMVQTPELQSQIHLLERQSPQGQRKYSPYIPIRFVPREKISKHDKLLVAFDAFASTAKAGVAFPGNDWVAFPNGAQYLAELGNPSPQLLNELAALRQRHLQAVADLLDAIEKGQVTLYLNNKFKCPTQ